jgi:hypothetical protein
MALSETIHHTACLWPQSRNTDEIPYLQYSPLWERKPEWLPSWQSDNQEREIKAHHVTPGGHIDEADDYSIIRRKKIKGLSSRQWERY